jgi:hypothetical protein
MRPVAHERTILALFLAAVLCAVLAGCPSAGGPPGSTDRPAAAPPSSSGAVEGTIQGTSVLLTGAEFDGQLALFEGDGWGWNPSLLIFPFLEQGEVPEGRTIVAKTTDGFDVSAPHVHFRWRDPASGEIQTEVVTDGYEMRLAFGKREGDVLPGTIRFSVPGEETLVEGAFRAKIDL